MFLFYESMACAIYLQEIIFFTVIFHIICISHYESIKSIDGNLYKKVIDAKSKQNCKLSNHYTAGDKRVWCYYNNNYYRIKDGFNVTSQTERRIVSTTIAQVITAIAVEIWRRYDFDMISWHHINVASMSYQHRILLKILLTKLFWKLTILSASYNNEAFIQ